MQKKVVSRLAARIESGRSWILFPVGRVKLKIKTLVFVSSPLRSKSN